MPRPHERGIVRRILDALNENPTSLERKLALGKRDIADLIDVSMSQLDAPDRDPTLMALQQHLDIKLGEILALREQLQVKLVHERRLRAERARSIAGHDASPNNP